MTSKHGIIYHCEACLFTGGCTLIMELENPPDTCPRGGNCPTEWVQILPVVGFDATIATRDATRDATGLNPGKVRISRGEAIIYEV